MEVQTGKVNLRWKRKSRQIKKNGRKDKVRCNELSSIARLSLNILISSVLQFFMKRHYRIQKLF